MVTQRPAPSGEFSSVGDFHISSRQFHSAPLARVRVLFSNVPTRTFNCCSFRRGRQPDGRVDPASPHMSPLHPNTILLLNMWGKVNEKLSLPINMPPKLQNALQNVR